MDNISVDEIQRLLDQGKSYQDISEILQNSNAGIRGFSITSVKRFCRKHGLSSRLSKQSLDIFVNNAVDEVINNFINVIVLINLYTGGLYY